MQAQAEFKIDGWQEKTFSEIEGGGKLTRADVSKSYSGEISGQGTLEYLMTYFADGSAAFVGMERIVGRIGDLSGSFVLQHQGRYEHDEMKQHSSVIEGSGTGDLKGLTGRTDLTAGHLKTYPFTLDFAIPQTV